VSGVDFHARHVRSVVEPPFELERRKRLGEEEALRDVTSGEREVPGGISFSTPSATSRMPSEWARLIVERTMAAARGSSAIGWTNERSSFSSSIGSSRK